MEIVISKLLVKFVSVVEQIYIIPHLKFYLNCNLPYFAKIRIMPVLDFEKIFCKNLKFTLKIKKKKI